MIFIYGDSHARFLFSRLNLPCVIKFTAGITMYRVGRDNHIIEFDTTHHTNDTTLCFVYGEIDCRCHIYNQITSDMTEDDVINDLVIGYIDTIRNNICQFKHVCIIGVVPTTEKDEVERIHGASNPTFPFAGSDADRLRYTEKMNVKLQRVCEIYGFEFIAPYDFYKDDRGFLIRKYSDSTVHIRNNEHFIKTFKYMVT